MTHTVEIFSYNGIWLALLLGSSVILLGVGITGTIVSRRTLAPNVLGYVASMTYNNAYFPLPERGGVLDATHRARVLRNVQVSVSDVNGAGEVGRIAFTSFVKTRPLEKGRKY